MVIFINVKKRIMNMKRYMRSWLLVATSALILFASCKDEPEMITVNMTVKAEQPYSENTDGTKSFLSQEEFIYWEEGDSIAIASKSSDLNVGTLSSGAGTRDAFYQMTLPASGDDGNATGAFAAVYPYRSAYTYNTNGRTKQLLMTTGNASPTTQQLDYPDTMPYRAGASNADFTFGQNCYPMVAYSPEGRSTGWLSPDSTSHDTLGFHSVSGILRLQFFAAAGQGKTVKEIVVTSLPLGNEVNPRQISGIFNIKRIEYYNPYLEPADENNDGNNNRYTIRITNVNQTLGRDDKAGLFTFYLPLPAQTGKTDGSGHSDTNYFTYRLKVTLVATDNTQSEKVLRAKIRRNSMTMMDALEILSWDASDHGTSEVQVVGNGTALRPFQVYTVEDLIKIRDAYNLGDAGRINGQKITENTYIKVVRTDIVLTTDNWTTGFNNFKGHFRCSSGSPIAAGITNNSHVPLFNSISAQGTVDSVTVKGTVTDYEANIAFSPLCNENNGLIRNCVNQVNLTSKNISIAGICVTNYGTITGSRNEGSLIKKANSGSTVNVAGICLNNNGIVRASTTITHALLQGNNVAGVCYNNNSGGMVRDCNTIISRTQQTSNWGCIVFNNKSGATVQSCYASGVISTSGSVGGIVNVNNGNILGCRNQLAAIVGLTRVAGIAATLEAGEIRNCFQDGFGSITTQEGDVICGGLVGYMTGGAINNSYSTFQCTLGHSQPGSHVGGAVGVATAGAINNVYVYDGVGKVFYSTNTGATMTNCYSYDKQGSGSYVSQAVRRIKINREGGASVDSVIVLLDANGVATETHLMTVLQTWVDANEPARNYSWAEEGAHNPYLNTTGTIYDSKAAKRSRRRR